MSVPNPQLDGTLLIRNRSNFLSVEGSTVWLHDCPQFFPLFHEADKCFDCIPKYYQDIVKYNDPKQKFLFAIPISSDINPQDVIMLDHGDN